MTSTPAVEPVPYWDSPVPRTVTREQYAAAQRAFCEALGIRPEVVFTNIGVTTADRIYLNVVDSADYTAKVPRSRDVRFNHESDCVVESSIPVQIEVVG